MELQPGAYFKVGNEGFEYVGTHNKDGALSVVGRLNPEEPEKKGALHRLFDVQTLEKDGVKIGPFGSEYPYSSFVLEKLSWEAFFPGVSESIPHPPKELVETLKQGRESEVGRNMEAHFLPDITLSKDSLTINGKNYSYPQNFKKPNDWFFDNTVPQRRGENPPISSSSLHIPSGWRIVDATIRPDYTDGSQMYKDDPLASLIAKLTTDGKISPQHPSSRFGISWDERKEHIDPQLKELLNLPDRVTISVPTEAEFNVLGNLFHPEWGEVSTYEWLDDNFEGDLRLFGGSSDDGGLSYVPHIWSDHRFGDIGFRPRIVFPHAS